MMNINKQQQQAGQRPKLLAAAHIVGMNEDEDDNEEENDQEDQQNMMSILLRIKQTKAAMAESRQRKNSEKLIAESEEKIKKEIKLEVQKFKIKWTKKLEAVIVQINALKDKSFDVEERANALFQQRRANIALKEKEMKDISKGFQQLFEQFSQSSATQDSFVANELDIVRRYNLNI